MSNTVDYLPVATSGGANVDTQGNFAGSGYQLNGFQSGLAKSNQANKVWRQASIMAAAMANFISTKLAVDLLDDGNLTTLINNLTSALLSGVTTTSVITGAAHTFVAGDAGFIVQRSNSGSAMIDTLPGTSPGVLAKGWSTVMQNNDASALFALKVGSGATINGGTAVFYIGPGQSFVVTSDGSNYEIINAPTRTRLGANTTVFVSTAGSDANSGLTSGAAFLTIQAAANFTSSQLDLNRKVLTIQIADGTYAQGTSVAPLTGATGAGSLVFQGNTSTPSNVVVSVASATPVNSCFASGVDATFTIKALKMTTSGSAVHCIAAGGGAVINIDQVVFGAAVGAHIAMNGGACQVEALSAYTINGSAAQHIFIAGDAAGANFIWSMTVGTVTLSGAPAFSTAFASTDSPSAIFVEGSHTALTFSGSATGVRYDISANGVVNTGGGGATYLPGNAGGTTATGGQYI